MRARLLHYNSEINYFRVDEVIHTLEASFPLSYPEKKEALNILQFYYENFSQNYGTSFCNYETIHENLSTLKKICDHDWRNWMMGISTYSDLNGPFIVLVNNSNRPQYLKDSLIHTILRIGEFYYFSDDEMQNLTENMESFLESGDCKLFDNENCPYRDTKLTGSLEEDIYTNESNVQDYLSHPKGEDRVLPTLSATQVIKALHLIKKWKSKVVSSLPEWIRPLIQICQEISESMKGMSKEVDTMFSEGIPSDLIMTKMSGFCLNKEPNFRAFLDKAGMSSWKNPHGSWLVGKTSCPLPKTIFIDTHLVSWWDMDVIYYSLGKGPWLKSRYVGQPAAFFQNVAELLARTIKRIIKRHQEKYKEGTEGIEDCNCINIYDNYDGLLRLIHTMKDSLAVDFSSYSDYLNRDVFDWIMDNLWDVPPNYRRVINHLMALPIKVNGKVYKHDHGSVMGIKVNFLLITFANALMWAVANIISGCSDKAKFMGDDRISVKEDREYSQSEVDISLAVPAYFNCVLNQSKTEWLKVNHYTSFCKRTFNQDGEQVSGLGGEFLLKQKPFISDTSVWLNVMNHNQLPVNDRQIGTWVHWWAPYWGITYDKFCHSDDPSLEDMIGILGRVPFVYGGMSLSLSDPLMDQLLLRSIYHVIKTVLLEADERQKSPSQERIRNYILINSSKSNRYYVNLTSNHLENNFEKIQEALVNISQVIDSHGVYTFEQLTKARSSARLISEIILQRDNRLASSTSTKNRIDFNFDQDSVAKIKFKYLLTMEEESSSHPTTFIDELMIREAVTDKEGVKEYFRYLDLCAKTGGKLDTYYDGLEHPFVGLKLIRENADGSKQEFWKRIDSDDSSYLRGYYYQGKWYGKFLERWQLTKEEDQLYLMMLQEKYRRMAKKISEEMCQSVESIQDYITSYLLDFLPW